MPHLLLFWAVLVGPLYVMFLIALLIGRRLFPEVQVLYEVVEPFLMLAASGLALALAGVLVQLV